MAKKSNPLEIANLMAGAAEDKVRKAKPPRMVDPSLAEGSPAEEAQDASEAKAPKPKMSGKQFGAMRAKGK